MNKGPGETDAAKFPGLFSLFTQNRLAERELDPPHIGAANWEHMLRMAGSVIINADDGSSVYARVNQAASSIVSITVSRTLSPCSGEQVFYPHHIEAIRA